MSRISLPGFALRLVLGEFAEVLLKGQRVCPRMVLDMRFRFEFPDLRATLTDLLGQ